MRVDQLVMSPTATHCHPLLGVINEYMKKQACEPLFHRFFFMVFKTCHQKKVRIHIWDNFHKFGYLVLGLGLVFNKLKLWCLVAPHLATITV